MLFASLLAVTATVSKWVIAGQVMTAVGTGLLTAGPIIDRWIDENKK